MDKIQIECVCGYPLEIIANSLFSNGVCYKVKKCARCKSKAYKNILRDFMSVECEAGEEDAKQ